MNDNYIFLARVLTRMRLLHGPVLFGDPLTDLVVGEVSVLLGALALLAGPVRGAADLVGVRVHQGVGPSVRGDAQHKLGAASAVTDVVPDGGVLSTKH